MEDSPDKLRRNLIVLSFSILFFAFLKPTFSEKGGLGFDLNSIDLHKAWLCILCVHIYVFFRFYHDEGAKKDRVGYNDFLNLAHNKILMSKLKKNAEKSFSGKVVNVFCKNDFLRLLEVRKDVEGVEDNLSLISILPISVDMQGKRFVGCGTAEINVTYSHGDITRNVHLKIEFKFGELENIYFVILSLAKANLFSKVFFDVALPYYLFVISFFVAIRNTFFAGN